MFVGWFLKCVRVQYLKAVLGENNLGTSTPDDRTFQR